MSSGSFSLTPGFSRVLQAFLAPNCFSSFSPSEKPLKRLTVGTHAPRTSLKRGVTEKDARST
jgi:hypothetical protein